MLVKPSVCFGISNWICSFTLLTDSLVSIVGFSTSTFFSCVRTLCFGSVFGLKGSGFSEPLGESLNFSILTEAASSNFRGSLSISSTTLLCVLSVSFTLCVTILAPFSPMPNVPKTRAVFMSSSLDGSCPSNIVPIPVNAPY